MSPALQQEIESALSAMRHHPQHDLSLGHRQAIYAALGPRADLPDATDLRGYQCRVMLDILTVRKLLPVWGLLRPGDHTPHNILSKAQRLMSQKAVGPDVRRNIRIWQSLLPTLPKEAGVVLQAALAALGTAIADHDFNPAKIDYDLTDEDDYDEGQAYRDAAGWGAFLYAEGAIWDEESSKDKRRQFWEWWLTEAVPNACRTLTEIESGV